MNKIEEFYKEVGGIEYDKFDKKANKFTYYDMIGFADAYHSKQLNIPVVSNRRELLIAYTKWVTSNVYETSEDIEKDVDVYLSNL